jgi:hypothetical protein
MCKRMIYKINLVSQQSHVKNITYKFISIKKMTKEDYYNHTPFLV